MQMNEKEFTQQLMDLSKSTMQKISSLANSKEALHKIYKIVTESETEAELIAKLDSLAEEN